MKTNGNQTNGNMKTIFTLITACSLAFVVGARAQQDDQQQQEKKKKQQQHAHAQAHDEQEASPSQPHHAAPQQHPGHKMNQEPHQTQPPAHGTMQGHPNAEQTHATPAVNAPATQTEKGHHEQQTTTPAAGRANTQTQAAETTQAGQAPATPAQKVAAQRKKPDAQAIKARNANFRATPKPQQVPAVTFSETHRITNAEHWQGTQYVAFRQYHPVWHDQTWYHSHYHRVELIGGGWYFFNAGYWYPAWGYAPSAQYYAYDGPIYAGTQAEPPDKVIANVQASLQEQGYYKGEVDGLLGPLTREALNGYQADNGLYTTGAIDEPTLASLGMA
jgi:hypothetical protein